MTIEELAHELWVAAQLMPWEGITDGVDRIIEILEREENRNENSEAKC